MRAIEAQRMLETDNNIVYTLDLAIKASREPRRPLRDFRQ